MARMKAVSLKNNNGSASSVCARLKVLAVLGTLTLLLVSMQRKSLTNNNSTTGITATTVAYKESADSAGLVAPADADNETSNVDTAVSGSRFKGDKIRTFSGGTKLDPQSLYDRKTTALRSSSSSSKNEFPIMTTKMCDKWAVVTTIYAPTQGVKAVATLPDWCLVIVGDTITPAENYLESAGLEERDNVIYLSAEDQEQIPVDFVQMLPFRSVSRKNVGFLFAIRHGAKVIFDFDDDNVLIPDGFMGQPTSPFTYDLNNADDAGQSSSINLRILAFDESSQTRQRSPAFNPLPLMQPTTSDIVWPRGFPLEDLQDETTRGMTNAQILHGSIPLSSVGIIQSVSNQDPDFDAIYRLTRPLPVSFQSRENLLVPLDSYTPYNAQATTHLYNAFWGMLLPFTVHGRVADIWRSYFTQRIMHDLQLALVYAPSAVTHFRSSHDYIADFQAENDLYTKTGALLHFLKHQWSDESSTTLPERIENLCISLYERDYIGLEDVLAMQEWLLALLDVGYQFPDLQSVQPLVLTATAASAAAVLGQIPPEAAGYQEQVPPAVAGYPEHVPSAVAGYPEQVPAESAGYQEQVPSAVAAGYQEQVPSALTTNSTTTAAAPGYY